MFARVVSVVLNLCRFRDGPQELPYAPVLAIVLLLVQCALVLGRAESSGIEQPLGLPLVLLSAFGLASTWGILRLREFQARFWQTYLALIATSVVFSVLLLLLVAAAGPVEQLAASPLAPVFGWLSLLLVAWQVLVAAHIWRHALDVLFPVGVMAAVAVRMVEGLILIQFLQPVAD